MRTIFRKLFEPPKTGRPKATGRTWIKLQFRKSHFQSLEAEYERVTRNGHSAPPGTEAHRYLKILAKGGLEAFMNKWGVDRNEHI